VRRDSLRNFCAVKGKEGLSAQQASRYVQGTKEAFMKQMKKLPKLETRTVALLTGLTIGLGIAVHDIFFVVAALIALVRPMESAVRWIHEHVTSSNLDARALVKTPRNTNRTERGRRQARSTPAVVVALIAGFLVFSGESLLYGGRSDLTPKAVLAVSKPPKLARTSTEIERGPRGKSQIALTFDAGANAECFEDLIAALESAHVQSTFFITGNWAQRNLECAKAITKHGHEVGNHTWNHLDLTKQPDDIVREEITRAETLLTEISGQSPRPRWRAPFGARDERVLRIAANLGYRSIYWTIDSLDSVEPRKTPQFLTDRVTRMTDAQLDGAIILMHVGIKSTADALPAIIANLQDRGFRLVTVSKLLESAPKRP
jgi:peptidoglycan/xylan/chitin deacetylase (PgdA/CDA1 family)